MCRILKGVTHSPTQILLFQTKYITLFNMETRDVETDQVNVTIKRPIKVIHFSDGIEEEIEEVNANELASAPNNEDSVDPVNSIISID